MGRPEIRLVIAARLDIGCSAELAFGPAAFHPSLHPLALHPEGIAQPTSNEDFSNDLQRKRRRWYLGRVNTISI